MFQLKTHTLFFFFFFGGSRIEPRASHILDQKLYLSNFFLSQDPDEAYTYCVGLIYILYLSENTSCLVEFPGVI